MEPELKDCMIKYLKNGVLDLYSLEVKELDHRVIVS